MENECPHGELSERLATILVILQGSTLDRCQDGPSGVHLGFQSAGTTQRVEILACGWMGLRKHGAEKGILVCDGSDFLLREAMPQFPKGEVVSRCYANPNNLAVHLHFANGDRVLLRPWTHDTDDFYNSTFMALWSGECYNSTLLDGFIIHHARLEPMSDIGTNYSKPRKTTTTS